LRNIGIKLSIEVIDVGDKSKEGTATTSQRRDGDGRHTHYRPTSALVVDIEDALKAGQVDEPASDMQL
jgi:hypothetical protein